MKSKSEIAELYGKGVCNFIETVRLFSKVAVSLYTFTSHVPVPEFQLLFTLVNT